MNAPSEDIGARAVDPVLRAWLQAVADRPHDYDLWQVLRHIEAAHPELPRLGEAVRPADEPVRISQPPDLTFAPTTLSGLHIPADGGPVRLSQRAFGLLGSNGPLPLHLTELVHERVLHRGDHTLQAFLDLFTHRFALLFYRAWSQAQPLVGLDRPEDAAISRWLGALFGDGNETTQRRDALGDASKLYFTGRLARQVRDADGLLNWGRAEFGATVHIEQWRGHWMPLGRSERTRLRRRHNGSVAQCLGRGAVVGRTVWDVQHKFRIVIGPLAFAAYEAFLPGRIDLARLQAMVRQWVGLEFEWDLQLILVRDEVPRLRLGAGGELGRSCWLGRRRSPTDADDLVIDVERTLTRERTRRATAAAGLRTLPTAVSPENVHHE